MCYILNYVSLFADSTCNAKLKNAEDSQTFDLWKTATSNSVLKTSSFYFKRIFTKFLFKCTLLAVAISLTMYFLALQKQRKRIHSKIHST